MTCSVCSSLRLNECAFRRHFQIRLQSRFANEFAIAGDLVATNFQIHPYNIMVLRTARQAYHTNLAELVDLGHNKN